MRRDEVPCVEGALAAAGADEAAHGHVLADGSSEFLAQRALQRRELAPVRGLQGGAAEAPASTLTREFLARHGFIG